MFTTLIIFSSNISPVHTCTSWYNYLYLFIIRILVEINYKVNISKRLKYVPMWRNENVQNA